MKNNTKSPLYKRIWRCFYGRVEFAKRTKAIRQKYGIQKNKKNIIIIGTPNHGNLGDYAIYLAEEKIFQKYCPDANLFGVNMSDFPLEREILKSLVAPQDLLVLTGGGNMGNQYMDDENIRRAVILDYPENQIVIFPQTLYFTEDEEGRNEQEKSRQIYNAHPNLTIAARDEKSYEKMQELFSAKGILLPDVVLTMGRMFGEEQAKPEIGVERKGTFMVFRSDCESSLDVQVRERIGKLAEELTGEIKWGDTVIQERFSLSTLREKTYAKWKEFMQAEIVVTDRLHGMIFAALTETPCLVFGNYNHKVKENYKWMAHLPYLYFVEDMAQAEDEFQKLYELKEKYPEKCHYDMEQVMAHYDVFMKEILHG